VRRYSCWFPEFDSIAFWVYDPSELSIVILLDLVINSNSFLSQLIQNFLQVADSEVDQELG